MSPTGRCLLAALGTLLAFAAAAVELVGSPPYRRHEPDLDVYPQNFAVVQDSRGIVYVGNTNGVLEYDGERWALVPLDNREIVRSLAVDADDRVLVGGYNAFGYLQRDAAGQARFVDLSPRFASVLGGREFSDIWQIVVAPEGVYFRALRDLFFWNPRSDAIAHWHHADRFGALAHDEGRTLLQFRGEGFRYRDGDAWVPLPGTGELRNLVFRLVPLADGGLLAMGVDGRWLRLVDGRVEPVDMPEGLPPSSDFERAMALEDGSLVLASRIGVVYLVGPRRRSERHFKIDPGYLSGLHRAVDGGFLVSGDAAIYRVSWPTPWSVLGAEHGADGSLHGLARWGEALYLLSSAGVFRIEPGGTGLPGFVPMPWAQTFVYDLAPLDARRALLATAHKLVLVEDGISRELTPELVYPRMFVPSRFRPGRVYVGTEAGLRYVDEARGVLRLSPPARQGVDMRVSTLAETAVDALWFGTERHGLWRAKLDTDGAIASQRRYGEAEGLRLGAVPTVMVARRSDGSLLASTHAGLFRWQDGRFVETDFDGLAALRAPEELLRVAETGDGGLWAYGITRVLHRPPGGSWRVEPTGELLRGALWSHRTEHADSIWFVASQSLLLYDGSRAQSSQYRPHLTLRAVTRLMPDGSRIALPLDPAEPPRLPAGEYGINFQFALPDLAHEGGAQYQGRLLPYEQEFSAWSESRGYTYSRLSPRTYTLQVRGRDGAGRIVEMRPWRMVVAPPWYATPQAWLLWIVLGVASMWLLTQMVVRRRTRSLASVTRRLEGLVAARTRDLEAANQRLRTMAHADGLTGIANRRRLDEYLAAVWSQSRERARPVAVLAIDVDHFKHYNDTHGHLAGDQVLKELAPRLAQCLRRAEDLLARYGGEEFLAVMPGAAADIAMEVAERMRTQVEQAGIGVTVSIGVASRVPDGKGYEALVHAADEALYAAKRAGRNRVMLAGDDAPG